MTPELIYTNSVGNSAPVQNVTLSLTVPTGASRILLVMIGDEGPAGDGITVTSVNFGGVALTQLTPAEDVTRAEMWYLINPTASTANLEVYRSGSITTEGSSVVATVWENVNQAFPIHKNGNNGGGSGGTSTSVSLTTTRHKCVMVSFLTAINTSSSITNGAGQTSILNNTSNGFAKSASYKAIPVAGSHTMSGTFASGNSIIVAAALAPPQISGGAFFFM